MRSHKADLLRILCVQEHGLQRAKAMAPSADGTRLYLVCACGQRRAVAVAAWEQEMARRRRKENIPTHEEP